MADKVRRRMNKRSLCKHISIEQRRINKEKDGKPCRPLDSDDRRYVAKLNNYCRAYGEDVEYPKTFLVAGF